MEEKKLAKGIYFNSPRVGAPTFVIGSISIKAIDAINFITENQNVAGYVNIDVLLAKQTGKPYCVLNEYVKQETPKVEEEIKNQVELNNFDRIDYPEDESNLSDIPF